MALTIKELVYGLPGESNMFRHMAACEIKNMRPIFKAGMPTHQIKANLDEKNNHSLFRPTNHENAGKGHV